jgi:hypothetical protein
LRRLDELNSGNFDNTRGLIQDLPAAVDLPETIIRQAIDNSSRQIAEANEAAWRDAFKPHAVILTERLIPQPLHIAAIVGGDRLKCVDFEPDSDPVTSSIRRLML